MQNGGEGLKKAYNNNLQRLSKVKKKVSKSILNLIFFLKENCNKKIKINFHQFLSKSLKIDFPIFGIKIIVPKEEAQETFILCYTYVI